ncbi:MAG: YceI family protein, partial [Pseudomonadota bacterium]
MKRWKLAALATLAPVFLVANSDPSALEYTLDSEASSVSAKVPFFGLASKTARFPKMEGNITIVPGEPEAARIDVTFDATALEAPDSVTLSRLRGEKFFWVEKYPEVRFVGERLELTSANKGVVEGELTARGVTQPATLKVEFE